MTRSSDRIAEDQDILYDVLDRALSQLEDGRPVDIDELVAGCEHLRDRALEMVRLASRVGVGADRSMPTVPGYSLIGELGQGGMGTVYLARQERIGGRPVALKILPPASGLSQRARRRFIGEALTIGRLRHPHIVAIHDVVDQPDVLAYAMEWVDGESLAQMIREQAVAGQPPDIGYVCRLGIAIARALAAVHRAGLVHRDVKPSNILLRTDGTALLSDFGLVRETDSTVSTQAGRFAGTVAYAAPEQLRGDHDSVDARSDLYSLGVTLFHALAHALPHRAVDPARMLSEVERGLRITLRRANPRVPRDLETIITKAMDADPARRYQNADELADDLERLLDFRPIHARRAGLVSRGAKLLHRNRAAAVGTTLGSMAALGLAAAAVTYVFVVPRWVAYHVAEARLALLDPEYANSLFDTLGLYQNPKPRPQLSEFTSDGIGRALFHYSRAVRWSPFDKSIRLERDIVARPKDMDDRLLGGDSRSRGLRAFLSCDVDTALTEWSEYESQRDMAQSGDPLVDAAQGVLYLVREQPARAYPRLRDAVQAFPNVGFLTVYLADAAIQCGDLEQAERLLRRASSMARLDPHYGLERVQADLLAAQHRDAEAEAKYSVAVPHNAIARLHLAEFLRARGRLAEAVEHYQILTWEIPHNRKLARAFTVTMDQWWSGMPEGERRRQIRGAMDEPSATFCSFPRLLRDYVAAERLLTPQDPTRAYLSRRRDARFVRSLQHLALTDLAHRMAVEDVELWAMASTAPQILKKAQLIAWDWPMFQPVVRFMQDAYAAIRLPHP